MALRVEIAFASPPDSTSPTWVDVSEFLRPADAPVTIQHGRSTELDEIEPSRASFALDNGDLRFTPGNPMSPYYPGVKAARQVRISTTAGGQTFVLFTGYLQPIEIGAWTETDRAGVVQFTAVDRLARLDRVRQAESTLTSHVAGRGGSALVAYYPLGEPSQPVGLSHVPGVADLVYADNLDPGDQLGAPLLTPAAGTPAPGDELRPALFTWATARTPANVAYPDPGTATLTLSMDAAPLILRPGYTLSLVAWTRLGVDFYGDRSEYGGVTLDSEV
ncbi:hypothetical protein Lfu02_79750 [Longispora fulva]|uniref:Uncharacterized protein n=1 Tax=Longispora fulva TaxID=619741 RepID=A0A8J7GPQ2_9ACTN|nr:hypothetical protein [Longispora fulva]MBG6141142.1 hypothetical protein [Longispora fulva]GIG63603.1 hypothetical protein Lfu02_79750 [Longispora fulva]